MYLSITHERGERMAGDYGKAIKHGLIDKDMSISTLAGLVSDRTGMYCDQPLISRIISGAIKAESRPVITAAIDDILGIQNSGKSVQ